jgi:hypothetical protein
MLNNLLLVKKKKKKKTQVHTTWGDGGGSRKEGNYCHNKEGQNCQEIKKRTSPIQSTTKEGDERSEEKSGVKTKSLRTHTVSD